MPISSGANSWPASYFHKPSPKQPNSKLVVIDQGQSRPPSPIRRPSTPPSPVQVKRPPPADPDVVFVEHHSPPPPQRTYVQNPPPPSRQVTYISQQPPPPPPPPHQVVYTRPPPPNHAHVVNHGYPGYREYGYPPYGGGGFCGDSTCCGDDYFSTNTAGANAGCCQGGMFGSRSYPYSAEHSYILKGTGRRRCCACVWGLLLGLLLLGLLIGLLAGLLPALKKKAAVASIISKFQNGYLLNGVYYYQVTNPPDVFYFAMGPGIPCNPHNNNSLVRQPTPSYYLETVTTFNDTMNVTVVVTEPPPVTLPDCNSITTSYVLAQGISVSTTTINPFLVLTSSAGSLYANAFATLLAVAIVRLWLALKAETE